MRIVGIERDKSACNYYRVFLPLMKLREKGMADVTLIEEGPNLLGDSARALMLEADMIVFHRPASVEWFDFIKTAQMAGKTIVVDYDDDPFNTSPWNPYYRSIGTKEFIYKWPETGVEQWLWKDGMFGFDIERNIERRDLFRSCFRKADMLTVTTDILQDQLKEINSNCKVLGNYVDPTFYPKIDLVKTNEVRIGWQGGHSHYEDIYMIRDQIKKVLDKYPYAKFVYMGDPKIDGTFNNLPQDQVEYHSWVSHAVYPYKLKMLNLDIGLCPIVDNEFNRRKSSIKHFEYAMVGASTIASNMPPYSSTVINDETGLLVSDDGWYDAIEELVQDQLKRNKLASKAYDDVVENYNIDTKVHLWRDTYKALLEKEMTEDELHIQRSADKVKQPARG